MNILISAFDHVPGANPTAEAVDSMLRALTGSIDAVTLKAPGDAHMQRLGSGKLLRVPASGNLEQMQATFLRALLRQFEAEHYDAVHVFSAYQANCIIEHGLFDTCKLIYEVETLPGQDWAVEKAKAWEAAHIRAVDAAEAVLVPTEAAVRGLRDLSPGADFTVLPPGINVDEFDWHAAPRDSALRLLFLGHFSADRDLPTILGAVDHLREEREVQVIMAGEPEPDLRARLRLMVTEADLSSRVHVRGPALPRALPKLISSCDIALVTATDCDRFRLYGDLPRPLLEFMACRRPIVGAGVPGIAEVLRDEEEGLLYQPGDEESLADAIRTLASNRKMAERLAQASYQRVRDEFSSSRRRRSICSLYERLLPESQLSEFWTHAFVDPSSHEVSVKDSPPTHEDDTGISSTPTDLGIGISHPPPPGPAHESPPAQDLYGLGPDWFDDTGMTVNTVINEVPPDLDTKIEALPQTLPPDEESPPD